MFGLSGKPYSSYFAAIDHDGVVVAEVSVPEIRHPEQAREFGEDLRRLINEDGRRELIVDLGPVRFLGSTGLATLLGVYRDLKALGGRLRICRIHDDILPGANISGLTRLVSCYPDLDSALAAN
jgi:anti-anti-sigma factor